MIVIADASCLIALDNIDETELLKTLYDEIYVTPEVAAEVGNTLPEWALIRSSSNYPLIEQLSLSLDMGEATSIALALELPDCILIIDERKGRRTAKQLGIAITRTVGIIVTGLDKGLIRIPSTILERLERVGFRISENLRSSITARIR